VSDIQALARSWAAAWQGNDSAAFAALFTADAIYRDDQAGRVSRGHEELSEFHRHFAAALSNVEFEFVSAFQSGRSACLEWISTGMHTGSFHGRPPTGRRFRVPGVTVLTLAPQGLISACTDYYDGLLLRKQLGG